MKRVSLIVAVLTFLLSLMAACSRQPADLILLNGEIYTMEEEQPWASAVVVTGNTITAVLQEGADVLRYKGDLTRVIDLGGQFVLPGFIDAHVHFNRAGALINDANLMTVAGDDGLRREIARVVELLDEGEWVTGGLWGAYEQWALGAARSGEKKSRRWHPHRRVIDPFTTANPCLLTSFDGELYLANTAALRAAGLESDVLPGMEVGPKSIPTGLIYRESPALERLRAKVRKKSHARLLDENRAALKRLAASGIVEVHDIARPDQTERFIELQNTGELTCRVWLRPDLSRIGELQQLGIRMGMHPRTKEPDNWLRYGALKGYVDGIMGTHGALFFEPYDDQPENHGHYRRHTSDDSDFETGNMDKLYRLIKSGYEAGFVPNVHAIGTKGVSLLLDSYERLKDELEIDLYRFRVIHAQVIRAEDFPRFRTLKMVAEVNPYHISDDMRWMEERIGSERCRGAYAFKSLHDNGATLSFGSDWPGTSAAEYHIHPKYLIHAAVNRTTVNGMPVGGWFPEQKISVHEALKAYTINNAYAAVDENRRGSIKAGKLADITVCDKNLIKIQPEKILTMEVKMTIVDGKIVYERLP